MPFKLIARTKETFHLELTDKKYNPDGEETTVTIRQAAQAEHEERSKVFSEYMRELTRDSESDRIVFNYSQPAIMKKEVYLTMTGCNIEGANGKPLFRFKDGTVRGGMTYAEFSIAWGELPTDTAAEIHKKVLLVNPDWAISEVGDNVGEETLPVD